MKGVRSSRTTCLAAVLMALLVSAAVFPLPSFAWPGAHQTLECTDCHITTPDPNVDTVDTVTFVNPDPDELCLGCHDTMRYTEVRNSPLTIRHKSVAIVPQSMYDHYRSWIAQHGGEYSPPLTENTLKMSPSGSGYAISCWTCHVGMGGGFPRIPMTKMELCISCHGGDGNQDLPSANPSISVSPRVLFNPTHLGVTDGVSEYPPPLGAPVSGDLVAGTIPLPVTVVKKYHNSVQEYLNCRIEIDFGRDGTIDQTLADFPENTSQFTPMRWYTGDASAPRWPNELGLYGLDTSSWPPGTHTLKLIPYDIDPQTHMDGNAYLMTLTKAGSSCSITASGFSPTSSTLNIGANEKIAFTGTVTSSAAVQWQVDIITADQNLASGKIVAWFEGTGLTVSTAEWDGTDMSKSPTSALVFPGQYEARLTAWSSGTCIAQTTVPLWVVHNTTCPIYQPENSKVNIASGELTFQQSLFSARGAALPAGLSLTYRSRTGYDGPVGMNWTHSSDISLTPSGAGAYVLHEGDGQWQVLVDNGEVYAPIDSAYPMLRTNLDGTSVLEHKEGLYYQFDVTGRVVGISDRNGNTVVLSYDALGNLVSSSDPAGRVTTLAYDATGRVSTITAPDGGTYTLTLMGNLLVRVTAPDGSSWNYGYDAASQLTSKTNPLGQVTSYEYDAAGKLVRSVDPEGNSRTRAYSALGLNQA